MKHTILVIVLCSFAILSDVPCFARPSSDTITIDKGKTVRIQGAMILSYKNNSIQVKPPKGHGLTLSRDGDTTLIISKKRVALGVVEPVKRNLITHILSPLTSFIKRQLAHYRQFRTQLHAFLKVLLVKK